MKENDIKRLRASLGLSQERFARLLGVSLQSVRRWEMGLSQPLPLIAVRLEEVRRELQAREKGDAPMRETQRKATEGIDVDFGVMGLGGIFRGVGGLFDLVSKMVEEGKTEETRTGQQEILGGRGKAVYGFSVKVGVGGKPIIEGFGNVKSTEAGPVVAEVREPLIDVFEEGDYIRVVAEMPGVEEQQVKVEVNGDVLTITAEAAERKYHKEVLLPASVKPQATAQSYRNGILELKLQKG